MSAHTCTENPRRPHQPLTKEEDCEACKDAWAQIAHLEMVPAIPRTDIFKPTAALDDYLTSTETF